MAKQLVNPIERHVDKGVLALAALILVAVVARYLVTSPNQLELRGEMVTPGGIDDRVRDKADDVREALRSARAPGVEFEDRSAEFDAAASPFSTESLLRSLPKVASLGPEIPLVGPPAAVVGDIEPVDVIPASKPVVIASRSTILLDIPEQVDEDMLHLYGTPVNWAVISSRYNRSAQMDLQRRKYIPGREKVYVGGLEVQRRSMRPDGSWSDDDWVLVNTWTPDQAPIETPEVSVIRNSEGYPDMSEDDFSAIEGYVEDLLKSEAQLSLQRPLAPEILNGDPWRLPVITTRIEVLAMDDEVEYPEAPPAAQPVDRYPDVIEGAGAIEAVEASGDDDTPQGLVRIAKKLMEEADQQNSLNKAIDANDILVGLIMDHKVPAAVKADAQRAKQDCDQLIRDIQRRAPAGSGAVSGGAGEGETVARQLIPELQMWAYDGFGDQLEGGKTYQYRTRVLLFNRMAGFPRSLLRPEDATRIWLRGEWSENSDEVYIEPDNYFFVTNAQQSGPSSELYLELYRWFEGVWVKNSRAKFVVGERVEATQRCYVDDEDRPEIVFEADATVLDIDFRHTFRKRVKAGRGFKFGQLGESISAAFVDSDGRVVERIVDMDKSNPARGSVGKKVFRPAPKAKIQPGAAPPGVGGPPDPNRRGRGRPGGRPGGRGQQGPPSRPPGP